MDCANASVYDGGTALFEACMMAVRATRRKKLVVDQCFAAIWRAMLETYSSSLDITLVTVPHKDGLAELARFLHDRGVELVSTGGTMKFLKEQGLPVTAVRDVTGFPEILGGRVKTLHPKIHGGILADKVGRSAPILMCAMLFAGLCVYFGASVDNKYASAVLLSCSVAFCTMGTPVAWTLLQSLVPGSSMSTASGIMNGFANGLAALAPALIGLFITLTGQFSGGLLCLVFTGAAATLAAAILIIQKY